MVSILYKENYMNVSSGEYTTILSELNSFYPITNKFHHETLSVIEAEIGIKQHSPLGFKCFGLFLEGIWAFAAMEEVILIETYDTPLNCISNTFECLIPFNSLDQIVNSPL